MKTHLFLWDTEDTCEGGSLVKYREGVDLVRYKMNLEEHYKRARIATD